VTVRFLSPETAGRLATLATKAWFRAALALACLAVHLALLVHSAATRFDAPFNAAPGHPPAFVDPASENAPARWNRLAVSRWDAGHYIQLGLRGYKYCPPRPAAGQAINFDPRNCDLAFYPTYGLFGRVVSLATSLPIDFALFGISLVSSFIFLFLWTGPTLTRRLGVGETYLSFLLFNTFTTGFSLVSVQTEPLTLALTLGAFAALQRRAWLFAGLLAGAASSMRITGFATGAACALGIALQSWQDHETSPLPRRDWVVRGAAVALCGWGGAALMAVHFARFGDALAYIHVHSAMFRHHPSLASLLAPRPEWLIHAMEQPLHEGVWFVAGVLWFLLGHRAALQRFPAPERAFWYTLYWLTVGVAAVGQVEIWFQGMNRYLLLALPLFFAMASLLKTRPLALAFWLLVSTWHYWNVDLCTYTGGPGDHVLDVCKTPHWMGRI
jgi:hypothetical protein